MGTRSLVVGLILLTLCGCGGDDDSSGANGGSGGAGGSGASTSGGSGGTGGAGGSAGASGSGGSGNEGGVTDCALETCYFVNQAGAPGGDGTSWSTAFDDLPSPAERGGVYFFGDGDYSELMLDTEESGEESITLKKATALDHGTEQGWDAGFGDGQARFPSITMVTDFWVIDGKTRNDGNWADVDAYGFRTDGVMAHTINFGSGSNDVVFRYVDVGGPAGDGFDPGLPKEGFYFGGFDDVLARWTISKCHVHDVYLPFQLAGASEITIEYSWLGPNWSKETIRGQTHASRIIIRHNVFKDGCQGTPGDPTATGCTAQIAMWDNEVPGSFDGSEIYGNVIWTTKPTAHSDACILVGGDDGVSAAGVSANDVLVYNNTIAGIQAGTCGIRMPGTHTGVVVANNVWYGLASGLDTPCEADTCENNEMLAASAFVDAAAGDFRLGGATAPGTALPAPYDVDVTGTKRGADGVWDLGAYEYAP
jgi:hypothetical protein